MINNIEVSVLVPILNAEATIKACIDSIIRQSLRKIEIICIDGGSTDGTMEIVEQYKQSDERVRVINSDKKSYGYQLNLGIANSNADYIGIVEADDIIRENMYEDLYKIAVDSELDYVRADYDEFFDVDDGKKFKHVKLLKSEDKYNRVISPMDYPECVHPYYVAIWSGLYRKSFLVNNKIIFNETAGASFQDVGFLMLTHFFGTRILFTNKSYYLYRTDNPQSSIRQKGKAFCVCDEMDFFLRHISNINVSNDLRSLINHILWVFYRKYKRNLERVTDNEVSEYYERFSTDFNRADSLLGGLDRLPYYDEEWEELQLIMNDPSGYENKISTDNDLFIQQCKELKTIIVYGAGRVGIALVNQLMSFGNIMGYAVTNASTKKRIDNVPVFKLEDLKSETDKATVIIASKITEDRLDMKSYATKLGFLDVRLVPVGLFDRK